MQEEAVQPAEERESPGEAKDETAATAEVKQPAAPLAETPATAETPAEPTAREETSAHDDVSYQAVEKEGTVTAIWEMQGQKHLRTIDPRSIEGKQILALFETAG